MKILCQDITFHQRLVHRIFVLPCSKPCPVGGNHFSSKEDAIKAIVELAGKGQTPLATPLKRGSSEIQDSSNIQYAAKVPVPLTIKERSAQTLLLEKLTNALVDLSGKCFTKACPTVTSKGESLFHNRAKTCSPFNKSELLNAIKIVKTRLQGESAPEDETEQELKTYFRYYFGEKSIKGSTMLTFERILERLREPFDIPYTYPGCDGCNYNHYRSDDADYIACDCKTYSRDITSLNPNSFAEDF
jgi:hypothetical protein